MSAVEKDIFDRIRESGNSQQVSWVEMAQLVQRAYRRRDVFTIRELCDSIYDWQKANPQEEELGGVTDRISDTEAEQIAKETLDFLAFQVYRAGNKDVQEISYADYKKSRSFGFTRSFVRQAINFAPPSYPQSVSA